MTNSAKRKVLIVEDEPTILRLLTSCFTKAGFDTYSATDGEEGLVSALRVMPDAIIFDILMPKMDGLAMIKKIRNDDGEWGKHAKTYAYTNSNYAERRQEIANAGVDAVLIKANVGVTDLIKRVERG